MNERKRTKICICIAILMLAAIAVIHICLGHYLRNTNLIDMKFAHYSAVTLPEGMTIKEAKEQYPEAFEPDYYENGKGPLKELDVWRVLIAVDIVLAGAGVFICRLYLSFTSPHSGRRRVLVGMFIAYIAVALILFFLMYIHLYNKTYTVMGEPTTFLASSIGEPLTG